MIITDQLVNRFRFNFAILYLTDSAMSGNIYEVLEDLMKYRGIGKIFLVSRTDKKSYDYSTVSQFYDRHVIYDTEEEDFAYHKRVIDLINKQF
jgi:hypothetical protein